MLKVLNLWIAVVVLVVVGGVFGPGVDLELEVAQQLLDVDGEVRLGGGHGPVLLARQVGLAQLTVLDAVGIVARSANSNLDSLCSVVAIEFGIITLNQENLIF